MARYEPLDYAQGRFISIRFEHQILPGSFEHALNWVVDHKLDLSVFDPLHKNDDGGAPAYDPRALLKIVLYAYSRGILSSRHIALACEQNIVMMALAADNRPHFTTVASFIRDMAPVIQKLFTDVLLYCDELGLIGRDLFAIDGCKISSNASKEWSGTREDFLRKKAKFEKSIERLLQKHKAMDDEDEDKTEGKGPGPRPPGMREREEMAVEKLRASAAKIDAWLKDHPDDKRGVTGKPLKQSMTDRDSAKMVSSHGVVQGYNGVAAVDGAHQVVVAAEAFGTGHEAALLKPMTDAIKEAFQTLGNEDVFEGTKVVADSGFHGEAGLKALAEDGIDAYVADKDMRKRDPAFATAGRHKGNKEPLKGRKRYQRKYFGPDDFVLNPETGTLVCPAGKPLYVKDRNFKTANGFFGIAYMGWKTNCRVCELRSKCIRLPHTPARQVHKFFKRERPESFGKRMIKKIDTAVGRYIYGRRMGIVEPVFGNFRNALGLDRFTLRGKTKVNIQWKLFALVHNLLKIQRVGWAGTG